MAKIRSSLLALLATASLTGTLVAHVTDASAADLAAIADRMAAEDLILDYYAQLGTPDSDFGRFWAKEGVFDVNGVIFRGAEAIEGIYKKTIAGRSQPGGRHGIRMVVSNLQVKVSGKTATARMYWTELTADKVTDPPVVIEYGIETAELVKQDGRWLYKLRTITSDGGMDPELLKTWKRH